MKSEFKTKIGSCFVPVRGCERPNLVRFKGSNAGKNGVFAFWTAVFKKPINGKRKLFGRARIGLSAGDRFDRMARESTAAYIPKQDRPTYAKFWRMIGGGRNVNFVRPSTGTELRKWLKGHTEPEFGRATRMDS